MTQGSLSTMLKTVVSGNNTPFTGKSFTAYHPVSQNWRDSYAKTPVSSTKPSRVQFEIPSVRSSSTAYKHLEYESTVDITKCDSRMCFCTLL